MPIASESFKNFLTVEMEQARDMAKSFVSEINLPISDGGDAPLLEYISRLNDKYTKTTCKEEKLRLLLDLGADPNVVVKYFGSPLMRALKHDVGIALINILLDAKADINLPDENGRTAVFFAVEHRRFDELRSLVKRGGNLNHKDRDGNTPITQEIASKEPSLNVVQILLELGADVNAANSLHASLSGWGHALHIAPALIERGANVNAKDKNGASPLALAVSEKKCPISTIEMLVKAGAAIDAADSGGMTPLLRASKSGHTEAVKFLLGHKASVAHCDAEGKSALHWSCKGGNAAIVRLLVGAGADIDLADKADKDRRETDGGLTPLMYAVSHEDTTKALLKFGPDVNIVDEQKRSALMHAIDGYSDKKAAVVEMLLHKGAKADSVNRDGDTALHLAVQSYRSSDLVGLLLGAKADANAVNDLGETPLMLCIASQSMESLIESGAHVDAVDKAGKTALIRSLIGYSSDAHLKVKTLLKAKANPDIKDSEGKTALMYASRSDNDSKSVNLLVEFGADLDLLDKDGHPATARASPDNLKLLITAGAKPNAYEGSRLANAVHDDNLPLAILLLERGVQMKVSLINFLRFKKTLEKLARSNPDLLRNGVECTEPEAQEQFLALLEKYAKSEEIADDADLPEVLKKGAWPIKTPERKLLVLPAARVKEIDQSIGYLQGAIHWPEDLKKSVLHQFKKFSAEKNAKTDESDEGSSLDYLASLLKKKGSIGLNTLFKNWNAQSEEVFISFWNSNASAIHAKVAIPVSWRSRSMDATEAAYLLARFDMAVLPGILDIQKKSSNFAETLRFIEAPACASLMARWMGSGPVTRIAREWALKFPESCTKGLLVDVVSKAGKERSAAEACLRFLASKGHRQVVEGVAAQFGNDVADSIAETLSQDHRTDFMPAKPPEMPRFWSADVYPPPRLKANNRVIPGYAIDALASMMSLSNFEVRTPALDSVIEACEPKSLANFAWAAFEEWAAKGQKDSEWIFDSLTYLGDDSCARKLTPFIRNWPRENGIARARKGLEILAAIGSDVALSQIQAISQKNKYQSVLESAQEMMKVIATTRGLSPQQLEDRLVPDLGLSDRCELKLNFGSRYFIGSVDAQLKPVIRDESGAVIKALPSAGKGDDKNLAKESAAEWTALCKDLKPIAKLQLERLELAMVNSRRWTGADFKTLFVASPLLQNLVKGLVWGVFPSKAKLSASFMVNAENAFVDVDGKPVKVSEGSSVGIVHPLLLDETSLAAWQKLFAKNKQLQPFAQLVRKTYRAADDIDRSCFGLNGASVASKALKGLLAMGWQTEIGDAGWIWSFEREFSSGRASLGAQPGVHISDYEISSDEQKLEVDIPATLNPMEFSELVRELMTLKK